MDRPSHIPKHIGLRLWLAGGTLLLAAVLGHFDHASQQAEFLLESALLGVFLSLFLPWMFPRRPKKLWKVCAALLTALALLLPAGASLVTACLGHWEARRLSAETPEREALFGGHSVMILSPHEDDELLMLGGVIEEYVAAGSRVSLVFATNGDHFGKGEIRLRESLRLAKKLGIPEDDVVFLGFGDGWQGGQELYTAEGAAPLTAFSGRTVLSALPEHPAFSEGESFTRDTFKKSLRSLLTARQPDVIFCVDTDRQYEHRTLSLLFEETMGELLRETDYAPAVYKCFAYASSWEGEDFSHTIIPGLAYPERMTDNVQYLSRLGKRFPVTAESVSCLTPERTTLAEQLDIYASQDAVLRVDRVMRAERAGFLRRTDSLLRDADLTVSSGEGEALRDFVISAPGAEFSALSPEMGQNGWTPDPADRERSFTFTFPEEREVASLVFYDSPSSEDNILSLTVTLSDGETFVLTDIDKNGAPSPLVFSERRRIKGFTVTPGEAEGTPRLAEVEAFAGSEEPKAPLVKLTESGRFAYELLTPENGELELSVFRQDTEDAPVSFHTDEPAVVLRSEGDSVHVLCPAGKSARIELRDENGRLLDVCAVANPKGLTRFLAERADAVAHVSVGYQLDYYRSLWHRLFLFGKA